MLGKLDTVLFNNAGNIHRQVNTLYHTRTFGVISGRKSVVGRFRRDHYCYGGSILMNSQSGSYLFL